MFLVMVGFGIVMPILPFFARRFGATPVQMGLLVTLWALSQFAAAPFWGTAADRVGRKPVLIIGLAGYAVGFIAMAFAQSYAVLLGARVLGGLLSASVMPAGQAIAADLSAPEDRSTVMGQMAAGFGMGFLVGPALGGVFALAGPAVPFYVAAGASLLALPLVMLRIAEPRADPTRAGARSLGVLAVYRALRSRETPLYLMAFAGTFGGSSMFSMLGYYAMDRAGGNPSHVSVMFTALGFGALVTQTLLIGRLTRRWGEPGGIRIGFFAGAAGFAGVALAAQPAAITLAVGLTSVAMGLIRPSLAALNSRLTTSGYGTSLGLQTSFDSLGRTLGPLWAGTIYHAFIAGPFVAASLVYLLAGAAALRLSVPRSARTPPR
jgi:multidrug resistance protein